MSAIDIRRLLEQAKVQPHEIANLIRTQRPIRFRRTFTTADLAVGKYRWLHVGKDNDQSDIETAGSGKITKVHTNLEKGGTIPRGELFIGLGVSLEMPYAVTVADIEAFKKTEFRYEESAGKVTEYLGYFHDLPPVYKLDYQFEIEPGNTGTSVQRDGIRRAGPPFIGSRPLFVMRGTDQETQRGEIVQECFGATTLSTSVVVDMAVHGFWFQRTGASESR